MESNFITDVLVIREDAEDPAHELFLKLQHAKKLTGIGLFTTGAILHLFKEHDLWQGRADSWKEFCASEAHSYGFAQTTIRLYKKYVLELQLPEEQLMKLMSQDYTTLDSARTVINKDNSEEWFHRLLTLGRDDLRKEIRRAKGKNEINQNNVDFVLAQYFNLLYDERQEFKRELAEREGA